MAAASTSSPLHLLLLFLLGFSHLIISMDAVPITRTKSLMHGTHAHAPHVLANSQLEIVEKRWEMKGRMNVELNDYPGSGANNRHTPRPQAGRSVCVDC